MTLDLMNISPINLTKNYDWLAFLGSIIAAIATAFWALYHIVKIKHLRKLIKNDATKY